MFLPKQKTLKAGNVTVPGRLMITRTWWSKIPLSRFCGSLGQTIRVLNCHVDRADIGYADQTTFSSSTSHPTMVRHVLH